MDNFVGTVFLAVGIVIMGFVIRAPGVKEDMLNKQVAAYVCKTKGGVAYLDYEIFSKHKVRCNDNSLNVIEDVVIDWVK